LKIQAIIRQAKREEIKKKTRPQQTSRSIETNYHKQSIIEVKFNLRSPQQCEQKNSEKLIE
jgi:hypothetical protein